MKRQSGSVADVGMRLGERKGLSLMMVPAWRKHLMVLMAQTLDGSQASPPDESKASRLKLRFA